jgi:hypothetical protein
MFGKITGDSIRQSMINVKNGLMSGYNNTKNFFGDINNGYNTFKEVYHALAPSIEKYGGGSVNSHIIKGLGNYETIRHKVLNFHNEAETVGNKLSNIRF